MNPNYTRSEPLGIEWEFAPGDLAVVAHIPHEGNDWICVRLDEPGAHEGMNPKSRAITRALLLEALRLLDDSEPARSYEVAR